MSDSMTERGQRDRDRVSASEPYELRYFARKHGISEDQARQLIARLGNDRATLDAAAQQLKA